MKREDAQKMCQEIRHYLTCGNPVWDKDDVEEALSMAIEALSKPNGDLISRQDAIECVEFLPPYREYWKGTRKILYEKNKIIKGLKELPAK